MGIALNSKLPSGFAINGKNVGGLAVNGDVVWRKVTVVPYLTFQSDTEFTLSKGALGEGTMYTSTDAETWEEWDGTSISSSFDGVLYMRGVGNTTISGSVRGPSQIDTVRFQFTDATNLRVIGNIETLLDWETVARGEHPTMSDYCYSHVFYSCGSLITPPSLPATTLADYCYRYMFSDCTSLTTVPNLPATTLATSCYDNMFSDCEALLISSTQTTISTRAPGDGTDTGTDTGQPYEWRIPTSGEITSEPYNWNNSMLSETGGGFTDNPSINTTYYTQNPPVGDTVATAYSAEVAMFGITPATTEEGNIEILNELGVSV